MVGQADSATIAVDNGLALVYSLMALSAVKPETICDHSVNCPVVRRHSSPAFKLKYMERTKGPSESDSKQTAPGNEDSQDWSVDFAYL
jgi:hypothetical protein